MKKGFISGKELLERWPNTDEGELLEILRKGYSVAPDMFPSTKTKEYHFRAWHPSYTPIKINSLSDVQENPTPTKDDQVPLIVDYPKDLFPFLKKCLYKKEQIEKVEKSILGIHKEKMTQEETEAFLNDLTVKYINSDSVSLALKGMNEQSFTCQKMGFKSNAKTWRMFIEVLQNKAHEYNVGTYDINKNIINIRNYNSLVKNISLFSQKFVSFLNSQYSLSLPKKLNVFKNMKRLGVSRAGTYKPKFRITDIKYSDKKTPKQLNKNKDISEEITEEFEECNKY